MTATGMLWLLAASGALAQQLNDPPFQLPDSVEMRRDAVYATYGTRQMHADLFLPKQGSGPRPAVVYVHGGGWSGGNKQQFHRQAAHMATKGFAGVCVEYRLSGEAKYPAAIDDVRAAIRWLRANARQYGIDPRRIGAAGGSAGGHLAALAGVTGKGQDSVAAVAAFNPAVDIAGFGRKAPENVSGTLYKFFGRSYQEAAALYKSASPLDLVHAGAPPFLFLHGTADTTVPYQQSADMQAALRKAGVKAEMFTAEGAAHGFFNRPPWFGPALKRMEEFFVATLSSKEKHE